jgi:deoxyribonuclease V
VEIGWPREAGDLEPIQEELARSAAIVPPWETPADRPITVAGLFVASSTSGADRCWAATCVMRAGRAEATTVAAGEADAPYVPGRLALREGRLLERAVRALADPIDVLLVNATGRDHPRGAGLAVHLGAVLDLPTIGVTDRPLVAEPSGEPGPERGSSVPLLLDGRLVGHVVRTRGRAKPVMVHSAWRTGPDTARDVVLGACGLARTPEPIRWARHAARVARAVGEGRLGRA